MQILRIPARRRQTCWFAGRHLADCRRLNRRLRRGTAAAETLLCKVSGTYHQAEPRNDLIRRCAPPSPEGKALGVTLPSSDEEGGKTAGFDGRRDNGHTEFHWFSGSATGASLPQSPSVTAPFSSRAFACGKRDQPARNLWFPARRCRYFAMQSLRYVPSGGAKK